MTRTLRVLSAGAAQGVVEAVREQLAAQTGIVLAARFGPVGALREAFVAGEECDVLIASQAILAALADDARIRPGTLTVMGRVATGVAVRAHDPAPPTSTAPALATAISAAESIYLPDPERATAGMHLVSVLRDLGIYDTCEARLHSSPSGAHAMRELAAAAGPGVIGFAQVTEILATPGVKVAGPLPASYELVTDYTAGISTRANDVEVAATFIDLVCGARTAGLRQSAGFEPAD